jgi:hypothetical protein
MLTNYYSGLITKGLGLPATAGFVTMHFSLFVRQYNPPGPVDFPTTGAGGGHVPVGRGLRGHSVQMRNVPINTSPRTRTTVPQYYRPNNQQPQSVVSVTVKFGGKTFTKDYITPKKRADIIVKVIGLFTKVQNKIKVVSEALFKTRNDTDTGDK